MSRHLRISLPALWLAIFVSSSALLAAGSLVQTPPASLETRLLVDLADGRLKEFSLCEAALIAAGCESQAALAHSMRRFEQLCEVASRQISQCDSPREGAAALLDCLHREVLNGAFQATDWHIGNTLENGRYNCLTATLLYMSLCRRFELVITGISTPSHVFCRLETEAFDVETTAPRWFELYASSRPRPALSARTLNDAELLAKVYYNRGLALLAENRYQEAVRCLGTSRRLDSLDTLARENEVAALNNWALALVAQRRFSEAERCIDEGLALAPQSKLLHANRLHVKAARQEARNQDK